MGTALLECLGVPVLNSYSLHTGRANLSGVRGRKYRVNRTTYFPFNLFPRANTNQVYLVIIGDREVKNKSSLIRC